MDGLIVFFGSLLQTTKVTFESLWNYLHVQFIEPVSIGFAGLGVIGICLLVIQSWSMLFGGRNLLDTILSILKRHSIGSTELEVDTSEILEQYRENALFSHTRLRFGDPTVAIHDVKATSKIGSLKITDVYTSLSVATEFVSDDNPQIVNKPVQKRVSVIEALEQPESHRALILGDPGAGKSTLVDIIVCDTAKDLNGIVPIHVRLSELAPREDFSFWHAVDEINTIAAGNDSQREKLINALRQNMCDGSAIILFDGIDEVSKKHVDSVIQTIRSTARNFPATPIVATCRATDYLHLEPNQKLDFSKLRLLPFDLSDIIDYVARWYSVLDRIDFAPDADIRMRDLQDTVRNSSELTRLASTPLLLTLMALVHTTKGGLPKSRALLYSETMEHLLAETPPWRRKYGTGAIPISEILPIVERIGFEMHKREIESSEPIVGLSIPQIENIINDHLGINQEVSTAQYSKDQARVRLIREKVEDSNGLFVETKRGQLGFSHRSLQEFAAGTYFLRQSNPDLVKRFASSTHWREPLILMAGYGGQAGLSLFFIVQVISELTEAAVSGEKLDRQFALLSGEMFAEIGKDTLIANGQSRMLSDDNKCEKPSVWAHVVEFLNDAANARDVEIAERITILRVLSRLGDQRLFDSRGDLLPFYTRVSYLPPTAMDVGDEAPDRPKAKSTLVSTVPIRRYEFDGFHVGKFLVTNAEFAKFIEDGGYEKDDYWCPDGKKWRLGDHEFRDKLQAKTKEWISRDFGPELASGKYRMEDILRESESMTRPRIEPYFWRNERYNQGNQPVVGINLWECRAFCSWLQKQLKDQEVIDENAVIRLPLEREWERAARGSVSGSKYPWGDATPTEEYALFRGNGLDLDYATPVGSFIKGRTNFDLFDVAGNVWEWTISRAEPLDESKDSIRDDVEGIVDVVVRGGSWFSDEPEAIRSGYRGIDLPQNVYYDVGFRIFIFDQSRFLGEINEGIESTKRSRSARSNRPI